MSAEPRHIVTLYPTGGDDTAKLASYLSRATAGVAFILNGRFRVSGTLELACSDTTLIGQAATIVQEAVDRPTLILRAVKRVDVLGLCFRGHGQETPWANGSMVGNNVAGIFATGCQDVSIENCRFLNHAGGSVVLDGACHGVRIRGNRIAGVGSPAITPLCNGADAAIKGTVNSIRKTGLIISDNDISGHCFGLLVPGVCDMAITGNMIHDIPGQHAMYLSQGGDMVIQGNACLECAMNGIKVQHQLATDIYPVLTICGNTVARVGELGICVGSAGAGVGYKTHNTVVTGNNVYRAKYGLYLKDVADVVATGNGLRACQTPLYQSGVTGIVEHNFASVA